MVTPINKAYVNRLESKFERDHKLTPKQVASLKMRFAAMAALIPRDAVAEIATGKKELSVNAKRYQYCALGMVTKSDQKMILMARSLVGTYGERIRQ